tara:strand:- start:709 stop:942 length:234 start_codon:yes stop_codon:yes gene_type:complete
MFDDDEGLLGVIGCFAILALGLVIVLKLCYFPVVWITTGSFQEACEMVISADVTEGLLSLILGAVLLSIAYSMMMTV